MIEITKAGNDTFNAYGFSTVYEKEKGICVNNIIENSKAAKFLENGDIIKKINNTGFLNGSVEEYCNYLSKENSNQKSTSLSITVLRNNTEINFTIHKSSLLKKNQNISRDIIIKNLLSYCIKEEKWILKEVVFE